MQSEFQDRIVEEYNTVVGPSTRAASISDLSQLKYTEACIKEGLRLYPPVHFIVRNIQEPMKLSQGKFIKKGCFNFNTPAYHPAYQQHPAMHKVTLMLLTYLICKYLYEYCFCGLILGWDNVEIIGAYTSTFYLKYNKNLIFFVF